MSSGSETSLLAVIDTNVIISGLVFGVKPRQVLDLLRRAEIRVCVSPFILNEVRTVLAADFGWSEEAVRQVIEGLLSQTGTVDPPRTIFRVRGKDDDNKILECAVAAQARFIISGDQRHLLPLKEYEGIRIVTPNEFLKLI